MVSLLSVVAAVPLFKTRQTNSDLIQYESLRTHHRHSCACWRRINSVPAQFRIDECLGTLPLNIYPRGGESRAVATSEKAKITGHVCGNRTIYL